MNRPAPAVSETADQMLIRCDEAGAFLGYERRDVCHSGDGCLHRAIVLVLVDPAGRILLQRRRNTLWNDTWDVAGATHPLHIADGDESDEDAARRCMQVEWNTDAPLEERGTYLYRAFEAHGVEWERVSIWQATVPVATVDKANPEHAWDARWIEAAELAQQTADAPESFAPWALHTLEVLAGRGKARYGAGYT